jgi:hypothetical protein
MDRSDTTSDTRYLPEGYEPSQFDVLCGRGRRCYSHSGNIQFRAVVQRRLPEYSATDSRMEKGHIISLVVDEIREHAGDGGFVKKDGKGMWYVVGEILAREKVSQAFRDVLHSKYKSSTSSKKKRRETANAESHQTLQGRTCELTLEHLERLALQRLAGGERSQSNIFLDLLDQDVKRFFRQDSFRGVNEMPVPMGRREQKMLAYNRPIMPDGFLISRSCPILPSMHGESIEPIGVNEADFHSSSPNLSREDLESLCFVESADLS